ncbi:nuclear transport factor 2 family protein [Mycobacterium sp. 3519A]|uniref:nuclear transport factor 2 family protein n=1 Tax=Mycobacterium sp. 3519A TaxID=2057184 RepID=UPI000C7B11D3|nr:nuclear transport factor 2 family protein [Mycobacterium sp. 3519A]
MTDHGERVDAIFGAFAAADFDRIREQFSADFTIWHNNGSGEQDLEETIASLRTLHSLFEQFTFVVRHRMVVRDEVFQIHALEGTLVDGVRFTLDAAVYLRFVDGQLIRMEEFYDPAVVDGLLERRPS